MTFTELVTEIMDRLNLSSTTAQTRIGRAVNRKYRLVTSSIGLQMSRRDVLQEDVTPGVSTVEFFNAEKIISVQDRSVSPYKTLEEVTLDELHKQLPYVDSDAPTKYALHSHTANTVTIEINRTPQTNFTLYADAHLAVGDLSGSSEPAFPESFHDVLIEGVMADELRKMEKAQLSAIAKGEYERILSDLRMWIAKSAGLDIYQGKTSQTSRTSGSGSGSSSAVNGANSWTQTGLVTFDRGPGAAPFAVDEATAAKVTNLDADKLDGFDESAFAKLADNETITGTYTFNGLEINDSDDSHQYVITPSNLAADRTVTLPLLTGNDEFTFNAHTQTLTNKTLTAPVINGDITGTYALKGTASVWNVVTSTATGTQNNWNPGLIGNTLLIINNASDLTITGIAAGYDGQMLRIMSNNSSNKIHTQYESASSTGVNRLINFVQTGNTSIISATSNGYIDYQYSNSRWRIVEHKQGSWITPTFAAGSYTSSTGTWVVGAGDVTYMKYLLEGNKLSVIFTLSTTTITGAPVELRIQNTAWGGYSANGAMYAPIAQIFNAATATGGLIYTGNTTYLALTKWGGGAFSAEADLTYMYGNISFEVV